MVREKEEYIMCYSVCERRLSSVISRLRSNAHTRNAFTYTCIIT